MVVLPRGAQLHCLCVSCAVGSSVVNVCQPGARSCRVAQPGQAKGIPEFLVWHCMLCLPAVPMLLPGVWITCASHCYAFDIAPHGLMSVLLAAALCCTTQFHDHSAYLS